MSEIVELAREQTNIRQHASTEGRNMFYLCKMVELLCKKVEELTPLPQDFSDD